MSEEQEKNCPFEVNGRLYKCEKEACQLWVEEKQDGTSVKRIPAHCGLIGGKQ